MKRVKKSAPLVVCHVFRSKPLVSQEVPGVIQRHDDHDETTQYIHRNQPGRLCGRRKRFCIEGGEGRGPRGCYHPSALQTRSEIWFIVPS